MRAIQTVRTVAVVVGEAGQVQRLRDLYEDVVAVVVVMATIVVMMMVALLVRMRHRCRSALISKLP